MCRERTQVVFGDGAVESEIMIVGEAPGEKEDELGFPFVGRAGEQLSSLMKPLKRDDVYITNTVLCRPPRNRDPLPEEIEKCRPRLDEQIAIIQPRLIVVLGAVAMKAFFPLLKKNSAIGKNRGLWEVRLPGLHRYYYVGYHPASALYEPKMKERLKEDWKVIRKMAKEFGLR